ncbi:hypothetical protein Trco_001492 [Trichoderma cornu-damae]|uniref:Uncharacterized protein n=1 Tax=Trichoderma cornu-damae TaxID=654480 RepID=A0A9P8QZB1_9HYPO|nr:hypothetical protein Trco_001492 [Trichoderma cornu-damae]
MDIEDGNAALLTNAENMSYYLYTDDNGTEQNTKGAPFPPGKERYDDAESGAIRPFICPVRECRALSISMKNMAAHFHGKHSRTKFNDNGDGTFSRVGSYMNSEGSSPGIIVSHNPLPPGAPPPATPGFSEIQKRRLSKMSSPTPKASAGRSTPLDASKRSLRADSNNDAASQPSGPPLTETLRWLHRFLSPNQQVPSRPDILALSKYERVRNLPASWIDYHLDEEIDPLHYACVLMYLVGRAEEKNPCRKWKGLSRLSDTCVALPSDLPAEARAAFSKTETCATCQYQSCCFQAKNDCDWAKKPDGKTEEAASQQQVESALEDENKMVAADDGGDGGVTDHDGNARTRRDDNPPSSKEESGHAATQSSDDKSHPLVTAARRASAATARKLSPAEMEEMEEMEDWEVAPGTVTDKRTHMNIGFSNAYMSHQHPIAISPGISFNVVILKPGHTQHWHEETNKVRTCSVTAGKMSVKMGSGQTFKLGPDGLLVIRPGQSCSASNRHYVDVVLHCTTVEDDFQA